MSDEAAEIPIAGGQHDVIELGGTSHGIDRETSLSPFSLRRPCSPMIGVTRIVYPPPID
jgi:hypothetical protein